MAVSVFSCPICSGAILGFVPRACASGHAVRTLDGIHQCTQDPAISLQGDGPQWLGYENVGVHYEPGFAMSSDGGDFGMFGACSRKLAELLGAEGIALDVGAGLGQAAIPLAMARVKTIAIDSSQNMLKAMVKRASVHPIPDGSLVCARMNAYDLKIRDASIDAVIAIDVLHQVDRPEIVVKEIQRVLKPDGMFVRYGSKGLPLDEARHKVNAEGYRVESDIQHFYQSLIEASGYGIRPFSSWEKAEACVNGCFEAPQIVETNEIQNWTGDVNFKLYKTKMRASGGSQLIPDAIHEEAWRKTESYALEKFGKGYGSMKRYGRFVGYIEVFKKKPQTAYAAK